MSTFGNTNTATAEFGTSSNTSIYAVEFTGGPTSGTLQSISFYTKYVNGANTIQLALYGATSGNLIGSSSGQSISSSTYSWITASVSGTLNDANGNYYIAFALQTNGASNSIAWSYSGTSGPGSAYYQNGGQIYGTWPSTLSS